MGPADLPTYIERFRQDGWFHCRSWQEAGVTLELLLAPFPQNCPWPPAVRERYSRCFPPVAPELRDGRLAATGLPACSS